MTAKESYRPQLDALRAIAVLAVFVHHFLPVERVIPEDFLTLGLLAVRLFFVLSGYLITGILLRYRRMSLRAALQKFYVRRALRILPIYYLAVAIAAVAIPSFRSYIAWHLLYSTNILAVVHHDAWTGHLWTLAVEEQFYLVWPFLVLLLPYRYILRCIVAVVIIGICWKTTVAFAIGNSPTGSLLTPACLDSLGIGALLAFIEHDETYRVSRDKLLSLALWAGWAIVLVQTALFLSGQGLRLFWSTAYLGVSLIFVWLIGGASKGFTGKIGRALEWRPLLYVGKISYGLYLYHFFMLGAAHQLIRRLLLRSPGTMLTFLLASTLSFVAAIVSWNLIEKPISRWKNKATSGAVQLPVAGEFARLQ